MVPTNTDEQCVLYLKWNIDVLLSGQFPSHDHLGNPLTGRRAERRGELAGGWRAAFVGHTADCKEKVRMHRLARNWACNFLCEKCLGCRRCVSLALSLSPPSLSKIRCQSYVVPSSSSRLRVPFALACCASFAGTYWTEMRTTSARKLDGGKCAFPTNYTWHVVRGRVSLPAPRGGLCQAGRYFLPAAQTAASGVSLGSFGSLVRALGEAGASWGYHERALTPRPTRELPPRSIRPSVECSAPRFVLMPGRLGRTFRGNGALGILVSTAW